MKPDTHNRPVGWLLLGSIGFSVLLALPLLLAEHGIPQRQHWLAWALWSLVVFFIFFWRDRE